MLGEDSKYSWTVWIPEYNKLVSSNKVIFYEQEMMNCLIPEAGLDPHALAELSAPPPRISSTYNEDDDNLEVLSDGTKRLPDTLHDTESNRSRVVEEEISRDPEVLETVAKNGQPIQTKLQQIEEVIKNRSTKSQHSDYGYLTHIDDKIAELRQECDLVGASAPRDRKETQGNSIGKTIEDSPPQSTNHGSDNSSNSPPTPRTN